jgi:hypothetical protein
VILGKCSGLAIAMRRLAIVIEASRVSELSDGTSGQDTNSHKTNYAAVAAREPWARLDAAWVGRVHTRRTTQCSSTDLDVTIVICDDGSLKACGGTCIGRDDALAEDGTLMSWRKMGH